MPDAVANAVARARRRLTTQLAMREAFLGFAAALSALALAILLGTELFPAWAAAILVVAALAWAAFRFHRETPSDYRVAQILDARLRTEDQLSTALHFGDRAGEQRLLAERAAESGDVAAVLPYEAPRTLYWAAGAAGVCLLLVAVRLGTGVGLDLSQPVAPGLAAQVADEQPAAEIADESASPDVPFDRETGELADGRTTTEALEMAEAQPPVPPTPEEPFEMPEVEGLSMGEDFGDEIAPSPEGETASNEPAEGGEETADAKAPDAQENDWSESSNNLLERLQEAFENLMEQMGMENAEQQAGEAGEQQSNSQQQDEPGQEAEQQAQAQGAGETSEAEMEGGETAQGEPQQTAQGSGDQNTEEPAGEGASSSSSGTGEGSKEIEVAAQQELAMDQLEEFYMERSEEMVGEIMVETSTAEQTAFTPFQSTDQQHADSGGAAARDEVPLAYRRFIENYFRNLRQNQPN